ncbi:creatininase [Mesorhizobium sp. M4B.F.Ca.ET.169.01.1.1]|uniref:creatininase n=1 Tax=unclassified Mesorhizobium TaxID=325217 RepID=UPI000FCA73A5|nr:MULTISPECIES: creatininase [unclassified Mesorhizobium]RVD46308.1 creatininase [Mesorhizobium sp. M4B.F.Ca.ET.019.03.1.1]TGT37765.1 creatininase [Mesorhizobium sp. M4B.F.Ca.ET.169.01.1.1]
MNDSVFLADLTWPEAECRIGAGAPVILPLGATEQHGHHMPLNVDVVIPTFISERVARATGALVAPTVPYGNRSQPRSGGGPAFAGTINLSAHTFSLVVRDVIVELHRQKVHRIVVLNGHYENVWPSIEGIELALDAVGRDEGSGLSILRMDHWEFVRPQTIDQIFPNGFPGIELEHASVLETSLMLAIRPNQVDLGRSLNDGPAKFRPYDRFPRPPVEVPPSGVLSMTEGASAEKGEWLLEDCVSRMVEIIKEEFQLGQ